MASSEIPIPAPAEGLAHSAKGNRQAGFYTPEKQGEIWDTWVYYHEGRYYQYYIAGPFEFWAGHDLAISTDGVHWTEHGRILEGRSGTKMVGSGHLWESQDRAGNRQWVANFSEWMGDLQTGRQDIMFITSTDLVNWKKTNESMRFAQDARWYEARGRWDCIDVVRRGDGTFYGYFTADPVREKLDYEPCGFGFARSSDGVAWEALPPVAGDIRGDLGGIQEIQGRYYLLISHEDGHGRVAVGDRPEGPFFRQNRNYRLFGSRADSDACFPRFIHSAPGGPLVNHHYSGGVPYSAPFKDIEVDAEGILRLKWWKGNDALKDTRVSFKLAAKGGDAASIRMLDVTLDLTQVAVIEGRVRLPRHTDSGGPFVYFDHGNGSGHCLRFAETGAILGTIRADGSGFAPLHALGQDVRYAPEARLRILTMRDMIECYLDDYLVMTKRVAWNGRMSFFDGYQTAAFRDIRIWQDR